MPPKKVRQRKIVKYNGVVLRRPDIDILNGSHFLNGRIIDFYFTYLDAYLYSDALLILHPSISLRIKETPDDNESLQEFLELLHLHRRKIIIVPIINDDIGEDENHWSLLVFVRSENAFIHYDSSRENMNEFDAEQMYKVLRPFIESDAATTTTTTYIEYSNTPKQDEPWACGVYILAFARIICDWYNKNAPKNTTNEKLWFAEIEGIKPTYISSMRRQVMEMVNRLLNGTEPCVYTRNYLSTSMTVCKVLLDDITYEILQDEVVLTYNGVVVRLCDFESFEEPFFLTDRAIEFYFSYLSSSINCDEILLVPPPIIFWLKDSPHDEKSLQNFPDPLVPLHPSQRKIIIFPLINETNEISIKNGGNHWSLLAFEKSGNVFVHHDSSEENLNTVIAECMYEVARPYVSSSSSSSETDATTTTYMEYSNTPKQEDPSDCGVHVLAIAKAICTWYRGRSSSSSSSAAAKNTDEKLWFTEMELSVPSLVTCLRLDVQELLQNLVQKQKRRPSFFLQKKEKTSKSREQSFNFLKLASKAVSNCSYGIASKFGYAFSAADSLYAFPIP